MSKRILRLLAIALQMMLLPLSGGIGALKPRGAEARSARGGPEPSPRVAPTRSAFQAGECMILTKNKPFRKVGYCFLRDLINPATGLVSSLEGECFTTVYKNALAAFAFIRMGDFDLAERIFDFFQSKVTSPFPGLRQVWNPCTGEPDNNSTYWEGDMSFLKLSLDYYKQQRGSYGRYQNLANALKAFLSARARSGDSIVAEGLANMFAALEPIGSDWTDWQAASSLYRRFFSSKDYSIVADHIVRGSLVFGDPSGFANLSRFLRTQKWQCNEDVEVTAYAAFFGEDFINVEISAQILVALRLWQSKLGQDPTWLRIELEKLKLRSQQSGKCGGVPYLVRHPSGGGFPGDYSKPIIDPTVWLLFDDWRLNPFAPGKASVSCDYGKFVALATEGQTLAFPRKYRVDADPLKSFPQEINDGDHRQIVIEFTTSVDLSRVPLNLTIATVIRDGPELRVTLDDGNHCLDECDRTASFAISSQVAALPLLTSCSQSSSPGASSYTYHLVLEATRGFGVFDWLQLEIPATGQTLWTIGNKDMRCVEFDNNGFVYRCN
ncbi:MAG TPA: hypothetical protein VFV34_12265 [Blastocatellia bacterium]|nr:hypothetical protein [Blastocatellia bacterium]